MKKMYIGEKPVDQEPISRLHKLQRMIAKEPGAADDMIEALSRAGMIGTLQATATVDLYHLEHDRADAYQRVRHELARIIVRELTDKVAIERQPIGERYTASFRCTVRVLK